MKILEYNITKGERMKPANGSTQGTFVPAPKPITKEEMLSIVGQAYDNNNGYSVNTETDYNTGESHIFITIWLKK